LAKALDSMGHQVAFIASAPDLEPSAQVVIVSSQVRPLVPSSPERVVVLNAESTVRDTITRLEERLKQEHARLRPLTETPTP
jgi:hypothetical protein